MQSVVIISAGKLSKSYWQSAAAEYTKRMAGYCRFKTIEIKERGEDEKALKREAEDFKAAVPKKAIAVALCVEGKAIDSQSLADIVSDAAMQGKELCFLIGSSQGLDPQLKTWCEKRISLSALTLPHQLARVVLTEQLYRAFTIISGGKYHK